MLIKAPELIEGMIEICHQRRWLETTLAAIKFSQCIVQGLWYNNVPIMQIPHISQDDAKDIAKNSKAVVDCLKEYLRVPDNEKKGLEKLSMKQKEDVYEACRIIPNMNIETALFVEEEEKDFYEDDPDAGPAPEPSPDAPKGDQIYEQDLVTLRITLTHENIPESTTKKGGANPRAPPVYAPLFPKTIRESWWLILTDKLEKPELRTKNNGETTIHAIEKISDQSRVVVHELRFMAPQKAGTYEMTLHVYSDCYMGLDQTIPLIFTVAPADELPEYEPHPEDVELDNEPTLFEQVMAANVDDSSDDEEEGDKAGAKDDDDEVSAKKRDLLIEEIEDSEEED